MIVNFLRKIAYLDQEVEKAKQELALRMDFNILDCFRLFDRKENGSLSSSEMEDTLNELGLQVENPNDLLLLFIRFDSDGDGKLRYTDFINIFTPRLSEFSELLLSREAREPSLEASRVRFQRLPYIKKID